MTGERPQLLEVRVTVPDRETAERIAHDVVGRGLAACVQVLGPITSVYEWQGEVQQEDELLLLMKTLAPTFPALCEAVREEHGYDVPEILAVPVTYALEAYGDWVAQHAAGSGGR